MKGRDNFEYEKVFLVNEETNTTIRIYVRFEGRAIYIYIYREREREREIVLNNPLITP